LITVSAVSQADTEARQWTLEVNGVHYTKTLQSGGLLEIPGVIGVPGTYISVFRVDSPFEYKGYMDIEGKKLSFVVGAGKGFKVITQVLQDQAPSRQQLVAIGLNEAQPLEGALQATTQAFPIFSGSIGMPFGAGLAHSPQITKNITIDTTNYKIVSARMTASMSQDFNSGADAEVFMNGTQVIRLNWGAFDTGTKPASVDVASYLQNGSNLFSIDYHMGFPTLTGNTLSISNLTFTVALSYIGTPLPPGKTPPNPFPTILPIKIPTTAIYTLIGVAAVLSIVGAGVYVAREKRRE
jgi:hypothetical protein